MLHLTLAGLSEDNKRLLLVSDSGEEFTLDIDARLRAALRGEHARIGQLEIHMESTLRPRDIQARIRAGETPEAVATAAHTTVDKILPFANPVLAERARAAYLGTVAKAPYLVMETSDEHQQRRDEQIPGGAGIAREMLPQLFDMFVQVDSSAEQSRRGLGVGGAGGFDGFRHVRSFPRIRPTRRTAGGFR